MESLYQVYQGTLGPEAPCVYLVGIGQGNADVGELVAGRSCTYACVPVASWDDDLTPWPAPGLYRGDADFAGNADRFYKDLTDGLIPKIERAHGLRPSARGLAGYSLAGLFSLYEFVRHGDVAAVAGVSPSLWYDGWIPFVQDAHMDGGGRFAYISIGSQEKRGSPARLRTVEDHVLQTARILESKGVEVTCSIGPGNHFQHVQKRLGAAIDVLDAHLAKLASTQNRL